MARNQRARPPLLAFSSNLGEVSGEGLRTGGHEGNRFEIR